MNLHTLILFVTSRCNARCETCFYWRELNQQGDLSYEEIERLSSTMPSFHELWLSGGEPLMRSRLAEIIALFYRNNGVRTLNLPTNGLFAERTGELLEEIIRTLPELDINLNLALDGFEETHDRLRGVPGNFQEATRTLERLYPLRDRNPNLRLHVNSVITSVNIAELEDLGAWAIRSLRLDGHYFQIIRGDAKDPSLKTISPGDLREFYRHVQPLYEHYAGRLKSRHGGARGTFKAFYYQQVLKFQNQVQAANYQESVRWPMACTAGDSILVIDYNGDVRACELRNRVTNLREVGCDFARLFPAGEMIAETEQIRRDGCWCTHVCFIHESMKRSKKALLWDVPRARV